MKTMTTRGLVVAGIAWLIIIVYASTQMACLGTRSCNSVDMVLFALIGVSLIVPAYLLVVLIGAFWDKSGLWDK